MIAQLVSLIFLVFNILILARVLMSWIQLDPYSPLARFIYESTEPFLAPIRRAIPQTGMVDFSPFVAMIIAMILQQIISQIL